MKLAAIQLMQQKANRAESPGPLENGTAEAGASDTPEVMEAAGEEGAGGLAKVKELAETIASDNGPGGAGEGGGEREA